MVELSFNLDQVFSNYKQMYRTFLTFLISIKTCSIAMSGYTFVSTLSMVQDTTTPRRSCARDDLENVKYLLSDSIEKVHRSLAKWWIKLYSVCLPILSDLCDIARVWKRGTVVGGNIVFP